MANPHKGEVAFEADGRTCKLSFSANAMCEAEEALGGDLDAIIAGIQTGKDVRLAQLRILFWQGLRDNDDAITLDDTKVILRSIKPAEMGRLLGEALLRSMPEPEKGAQANPPQPGGPDGTGPASSTDGSPPDSTKTVSGG